MNVYKSSFLIIGKGVTYEHCKNFFEENSIDYKYIDTKDSIGIKNNNIILSQECQERLNQKKINLDAIDYFVVSPGIPKDNYLISQLSKYKSDVITDIDIVQNIIDAKLICVTGTNGKTSTVSLLAEVLNANSKKAIACGNNGTSVFEALKKRYEYVVLEISSYQLEYIKKLHSHISVILNITNDHLDRHLTFQKYLEIKSKILKNAKHTVTNKLFNIKNNNIFDIQNDYFYINDNKIESLKLLNSNCIEYKKKKYEISGRHEALNLCACIAILKIIGIETTNIFSAFEKRELLPHRLEAFTKINNINFINDSKSTNADSTMNALLSSSKNIILIMGGDNKKTSFDSLNSIINEKVKLLVLIGENRNYLDRELKINIKKKLFHKLNDATSYIFNIMEPGDTVLLSPGTSSFYMYENYEARGNHFKKIVNEYVSSKD
tara:strand:+ start:1588 stop:2895 length:1308 start_codon:yes stop_codon:yes gene_type:complete